MIVAANSISRDIVKDCGKKGKAKSRALHSNKEIEELSREKEAFLISEGLLYLPNAAMKGRGRTVSSEEVMREFSSIS